MRWEEFLDTADRLTRGTTEGDWRSAVSRAYYGVFHRLRDALLAQGLDMGRGGAADKVLRVAAEPPYLLHLEFVAGHDATALPRKLLIRNGLLEDRHDLGVRGAAVLLRPEADSSRLTGVYERGFPGEEAYLTFRYQMVRVWRLPRGRF